MIALATVSTEGLNVAATNAITSCAVWGSFSPQSAPNVQTLTAHILQNVPTPLKVMYQNNWALFISIPLLPYCIYPIFFV